MGPRGNEVADGLLRAIRAAGYDGMTGTQMRDNRSRHLKGADRRVAIKLLEDEGLVVTIETPTAGAPVRTTYAVEYSPEGEAIEATQATEGTHDEA